MSSGNINKLEEALAFSLKELQLNSVSLCKEGVEDHKEQGRGAYVIYYRNFTELMSLSSRGQIAPIRYLPYDHVMDLKFQPVKQLMDDYNPANSVVALIGVSKTFKSNIIRKDAYLSVKGKGEDVSKIQKIGAGEFKDNCCDNPNCDNESIEKMLQCSRCKDAMYCTRDCQRADWKAHKKLCNTYIKEMQDGMTNLSVNNKTVNAAN